MGRPKAGAKKAPLKCPGGRCYADSDSFSSESDCSDSDCSDCYDCGPKKKRTAKKTATKSKAKSKSSKSKGKKKTASRRKPADTSDSCSCSDCEDYSSDDSFDCPPKRGGGRKCSAC
ncbi:dentin sialophosphoprotein-like [Nasonia vitripennis]|uniref:Uncharacterized protein n=1 Tax=Nasonia vitripennis TaxID=7425 RepID=A0A7M7G1S6_NASVI|nr:dentin sialophosphoprotein-like [Nasonia vitripennis]